MLFSHPGLAAHMTARFECAFESVRSVPHVTIDLGGGQVLERTLGGNVITWFCTPDGRAYDVQPGVMTVDGYRAALDAALALHARIATLEGTALEVAVAAAAREAAGGWAEFVEGQLAEIGGPGSGPGAAPLAAATQRAPGFAALERLAAFPSFLPLPPGFGGFQSKTALELPLIGALAPSGSGPPLALLDADSFHARTNLRPRALGLLAARPLAPPHQLGPHLYRLVLGIDVADPFLGLAPAVLGRTDGFLDGGR